MRIICVLQGETCILVEDEKDAQRVIKDWLEDGYTPQEIKIFRRTPQIPFMVKAKYEIKILGDGQ